MGRIHPNIPNVGRGTSPGPYEVSLRYYPLPGAYPDRKGERIVVHGFTIFAKKLPEPDSPHLTSIWAVGQLLPKHHRSLMPWQDDSMMIDPDTGEIRPGVIQFPVHWVSEVCIKRYLELVAKPPSEFRSLSPIVPDDKTESILDRLVRIGYECRPGAEVRLQRTIAEPILLFPAEVLLSKSRSEWMSNRWQAVTDAARMYAVSIRTKKRTSETYIDQTQIWQNHPDTLRQMFLRLVQDIFDPHLVSWASEDRRNDIHRLVTEAYYRILLFRIEQGRLPENRHGISVLPQDVRMELLRRVIVSLADNLSKHSFQFGVWNAPRPLDRVYFQTLQTIYVWMSDRKWPPVDDRWWEFLFHLIVRSIPRSLMQFHAFRIVDEFSTRMRSGWSQDRLIEWFDKNRVPLPSELRR